MSGCFLFHAPAHFRGQRALAEGPRPSLFGGLTAARYRKRVAGYVVRDHRTRSDIGPLPDRHRRDEAGIRPNEGPGPDFGPGFDVAVIVARDGAGTDIRLRADARIADIAEVADFRARPDIGILDFDEVADFRLLP